MQSLCDGWVRIRPWCNGTLEAALLVLYSPAVLSSNCGGISGLHLDCVGITDCVRLLVWEMKHVVSAVIEMDCVPGHSVGLDDWSWNIRGVILQSCRNRSTDVQGHLTSSIYSGTSVEQLRWDCNRIKDCIWIIRIVGMLWLLRLR